MIDTVVTLQGAYFRGPYTLLARDSAGLFYLVDSADGLLKVYGTDGRYLREIGRQGGGPGEYETIRNVLVARDGSVHVLDAELARHSRFSTDGQFLGSTVSPVLIGGVGMPAVLLPDGRVVLLSRITRVNTAFAGLQVMDREGKATRLLAEGPPPTDSVQPWRRRRQLWVQADGHLLVAHPYSFTIDVYTPDLSEKLSIKRVGEWIPFGEPEEPPSDGTFDRPFTPVLSGMWDDAEGLVWLHMVVPSSAWKPGPPEDRAPTMSKEEFSKLAERPRRRTIIEAVDLNLRRVVARLHIDGGIGMPFAGGYYAQYIEDSTGEPGLQILHLRFVR